MSAADDLKKTFAEMEKRFKPNKIDKETSFYFSLGEDAGEKWTLVVGPQSCKFSEGKPAKDADVVLKTSSKMFLDMINGKYTPGAMDFMRGKIKSNDPQKLLLLKEIFG